MSAAAAKQQPLRSPSDQRRSSLIAKIHVAKSQLRMTDDDYRSILVDEASVMSSTKATTEGLVAVLKRMERLGFKPLPPKPRRKSGHVPSRVADHPTARKSRAMWLSLHQLGVVHNASEEALEAFACKQLKIAKLQWADQATGYRLIEALKAMAERAGWSQDTSDYEKHDGAKALKRNLVIALHRKLIEAEAIPANWSIPHTLQTLFGEAYRPNNSESLELAAVSLGQKLREVSK